MSQSEQKCENNKSIEAFKHNDQLSVESNVIVNTLIVCTVVDNNDAHDTINNESYVLGYN